jgi:serine protease Do
MHAENPSMMSGSKAALARVAIAALMAFALAPSAGAQDAPPPAAEPPAASPPAMDVLPDGDGALPAPVAPPSNLPAPLPPSSNPIVTLPPEEPPAGIAAPTGVSPGPAPFSFADLAEELQDSVVYISTAQNVSVANRAPTPDEPEEEESDEFFEEFFDDAPGTENPSRRVESLGSGFIVDASGFIVTNNHVIADADEIIANMADGRKLTAEVVGRDEKTDLALLKVESPVPLKAARLGRSQSLRVGEWVMAIGNPFGFGGSVSVGIVSALDRDINSGPYDHFIQTDAAINRGNSGGPLFNLAGEAIGINTAIMSPSGGSIGIGFAVPTEIAVPVIEQLREYGEVRRGWIGVRIQEVTEEFAETLGLDSPKGALIAGVTPGGPAEEAGLKAGDVVLRFDGRDIGTMRSLPQIVAGTAPETEAEIVVLREGEEMSLDIAVGLLEDETTLASAEPDDAGEDAEPDAATASAMSFGLTLGELTQDARRIYSIDPDVKGVLITAVETGSEAEKEAIQVGEVIVQVSHEPVAEPEDVTSRLEAMRTEGRRRVMLLIAGAAQKLRFVSLNLDGPQP